MNRCRMSVVLLLALCACGSSDSEDAVETTSALGGIAFVQVASSTPQSSPTSVVTTYGAAQIAGDTNIVPICWFNASSNVARITDTKGNVYSVAAPVVRLSGTASCTMYYAPNIKAAAANANAVTVTFSGRTLDPDVRISEYSGLSAAPLDTSAGATGNGTSASSGIATTTAAGDLVVGADFLQTSTNGAGPGFTSRVITSPDSDILEDEITGGAGSYSAGAPTGGGWWVMQMAAFKPATVADAGASEAGRDASGAVDAADAGRDSGVDAGMDAGAEAGSDSASSSGDDASVDSGSFPDSGSPATLVQHVSGSNLRGNALASPYCYSTALASPAQAGNSIVVGVTWQGSATLSVTDDKGDRYSNAEVFDDATDNQSIAIATSIGVAAGARNLNVCFSSSPGGWVQPAATEFAGIVGIDGAGSAAKGIGTVATSGSLTPRGSDLLYQVVYTPGGPPSRFAAGSGSTLLSADIQDGWAAQYGPATAAAPSISLGSSVHWATAALLLRTGNAGSVPTGMRILRLQHDNLPVSAAAGGGNTYYATPTAIEFPATGNLRVASIAGGNGTNAPPFVTGVTDGNANVWAPTKQAVSGDAMTQIFYAANAASGNPMLSVTWNDIHTDDSTAMLYDVVGASSTPLDTAAAGAGANNGGNLTLPFTITPAQAGELVIVATPWDFDTAGGLIGGLMDTNITSGESESGPFPVDENNGWGHAISTSTAPMSFTWIPLFNGIEFGGYSAVAAAFKPSP